MAGDDERSSSEQRTSPDPLANRSLDVDRADGLPGKGGETGAPPDANVTGPPAGSTAPNPAVEKTFQDVVHSDIGVEVLLGRAKMCLAGHRDMATFFKEIGGIYDKHANAQKKVVRTTLETIKGSERKHGQYATAVEEGLRRMDVQADFFGQFALQCSQMYEELSEQAKVFDERRKNEKQNGLAAEKRAQSAEEEMGKARNKRDRLAEDLDKVKTGDKSGRGFGRLGTKSQAQAEEDLTRKLQAADSDYQQKTQTAQQVRTSLLQAERPATVSRLIAIIRELDAALCLQYGFFVHHMEIMISKTGRQLLPVNGRNDPWRLANKVSAIDQESDFKTYVNSFVQRVGNTQRELKYEPHPTQRAGAYGSQAPSGPGAPIPTSGPGGPIPPGGPGFQSGAGPQSGPGNQGGLGVGGPAGPNNAFRSASNPLQGPPTVGAPQHQRQFSGPQGGPQGGYQSGLPHNPASGAPPGSFNGPPHLQASAPTGGSFMGPDHPFSTSPQDPRPSSSGRPPYGDSKDANGLNNGPGLPADPRSGFGRNGPGLPHMPYPGQPGPPQSLVPRGGPPYGGPSPQAGPPPGPNTSIVSPAHSAPSGSPVSRPGGPGAPGGAPPTADRPMFGMRLQALYERDGTPVPILVHECIQAVDLYGLKVDGIYRVSGTSAHITRLRQLFDHDPGSIDFREPETFFHDINSVTGLLKQFFRDLPGGLLTEMYYRDFIEAAKIEDADQRRDALHATINALPDTNYATLRALCLHLYRVQELEAANRMTSANLAICFGPTILVPANASSRDLADAGWQVKAMETVFANTLQIFDDD